MMSWCLTLSSIKALIQKSNFVKIINHTTYSGMRNRIHIDFIKWLPHITNKLILFQILQCTNRITKAIELIYDTFSILDWTHTITIKRYDFIYPLIVPISSNGFIKNKVRILFLNHSKR